MHIPAGEESRACEEPAGAGRHRARPCGAPAAVWVVEGTDPRPRHSTIPSPYGPGFSLSPFPGTPGIGRARLRATERMEDRESRTMNESR